MKKYLIIGAGIAGMHICENLKKLSPKSQITILSNEKVFPYNRIWITDLLANPNCDDSKYFWLKNENWFAENNIKIHTSVTVKKINYSKKEAYDQFGNEYKYDKLFLTAGSRGASFPIEGINNGKGVFNNIFYHDTQEIHRHLLKNYKKIHTVVIMGGGVLGLEATDALKQLMPHLKFVIIDIAKYYLSVMIDKDAGDFAKKIIKKQKIDSRFETSISKFNFDEENNLKSIITNKNEEINCQLCIVSVGNVSNFQNFLEDKKLKVNRGIIVNEYMETSVSNVYAAGDIIEIPGIVLPKLLSVSTHSACIALNTALNGPSSKFVPKKYNVIFSGLNMEIITIGLARDVLDTDKVYKKHTANSFVKYVFRKDEIVWAISINDQASYREIIQNKCKPF